MKPIFMRQLPPKALFWISSYISVKYGTETAKNVIDEKIVNVKGLDETLDLFFEKVGL